MINELFEVLPEYVAFQILTYTPHKTAEIMRQHWDFLEHESNMINVLTDIRTIYDDMLWAEEDTGVPFTFYCFYMYNVSPQWSNNIATVNMDDNGIEWYL